MPNPSYWFQYDSGSITDPLSFSKLNQRPTCCSGHIYLCAIFAESQTVNGVLRPIISGTALQTEIPSAINTSTPTEAVLLSNYG